MILEFIIVLILSQLALGLYLWYQVKDLYKFPNLFGYPVIGNLYYFYEGLLFKSLDTLYNYELGISNKIGNGIYFGIIKGRRSVVLSCPHIIEEISYNPNAAEKAPNVYGAVNPLVKGIFVYCPIDSEYKLRRKEVNNSLTKTMIEKYYYETFTKGARQLVEAFRENQNNADLVYHCTFTSINIVKATHCGIEKFMPENDQFYKTWVWIINAVSVIFANTLVAAIFSLTFKFFDRYFMKKLDMLKEQVGSSVKDKLKTISKDPTAAEQKYIPLAVVIALRVQSRKLGRFELTKELYELLIAGSHTGTVTMVGAFAYMATLPEIQEKLWNEQYEIFGTSKRDPTIEDTRKMTYLDKFLKEILRFFSPGIIGKVTTGEVKAGGVTIPKGTVIHYLLRKIRMDPEIWKDPLTFNPDKDFENKPKYANAAFGLGVRSCPGMQYAKLELKIILSVIIRNFKLSSKQKFEDFRYETHLMAEIVNLKPIQLEPRLP